MQKVARVSVLESDGNPQIDPTRLRYALSLADAELKIGFITDSDFNYSSDFWWEYTGFRIESSRIIDGELSEKRPSLHNLPDLIETIDCMANSDIHDELIGAVRLFLSLDALPDDANMKQLGYFSVIEALLSHAPKPNDSADSIQRQLTRNLILIDHRLREVGRSLGFDNFSPMKPEKLIKTLYTYRSKIAHGDNGVDQWRILDSSVKDRDIWPQASELVWLRNWLRRLVRRVLFAAIREPQLVTDLK